MKAAAALGAAMLLAGALCASAQTLEQRFERIFGPPTAREGSAPGLRRSRPSPAPSASASSAPQAPGAAPPLPTASPEDRATPAPADESSASPAPAVEPSSGASDERPANDPGSGEPAETAPAEPENIAADPDPEAMPAVPAGVDVPVPEERPEPESDAGDPVPQDPAADAAGEGEAAAGEPAEPEVAAPGASEPAAGDEPSGEADAGEPSADAPAPAYVSPERARTDPEDTAPSVPPAAVTPEESVEAARAIEDARLCESELEARGAEFTVEPTISEGRCGVLRPVSLTRTSSGVAIRGETQMLCRTALSLDVWTSESVVPAATAMGRDAPEALGGISTYVCRDRASETGLSEHARGSAIDVGIFEWAENEPVRVEPQAAGSPEDRFLAAVRIAACGPFRTVLGPGSDADHATHFHFDIAARSNGSLYCR